MDTRLKEKKYCGFAFLAVFLFILSSCSSVSGDKRLYAYLTDRSKYILLSPAGIEKPLDMAQQISASYGGQSYYFSSWVLADENGIDMSFFNELGASMGDLSYREGAVSLSSAVLPKALKPEYMVADFQLCFYDPVLVRRALEDCGLTLEIQGTNRRIFRGRNLIIEIERTFGAVKFVNHLRGYSYVIEEG
jgi:hypothetical protein